ncbi:hypothetical protein ABZS96_33815 [Streptomyces avermitilis]|uniref:hypothetical protein n=1 Tax=Streptomyces avermitilis TaxID=33903 RepID=UPI0033BE7303
MERIEVTHTASLHAPHPGLGDTLTLQDKAHVGGEGAVYFTTDGRHALKVFHQQHPGLEQHLTRIMDRLRILTDEQERFILPPLALLNRFDGQPRQGFVMRRVPPRYQEAINLILGPEQAAAQFQRGRTWGSYLLAARSIANSIVVLHAMGFAHSDIHYKNFLVDINEGDAVMMEADGIVTPGYSKARVAGLKGFMAPEILTRGAEPSEKTDRHSLAVLALHTLLFRNPLEPLIEYADDPQESDRLGWGAQALFSEHPGNPSHRPANLGRPLYKRGVLSYRMLTPELQQLAERAVLETGLHDPASRPAAKEWRDALAKSIDQLLNCPHCGQHFPYPHWLDPPPRRACPFCGQRCQRPLPAVISLLEERRTGNFTPIRRKLVLGNGSNIFADMTEPHRFPPRSRTSTKPIGHVEWDPRGAYRIVNDGNTTWISITNSASTPRASVLQGSQRLSATSGQSIPLNAHALIRFGPDQRAAVVDDPGG